MNTKLEYSNTAPKTYCAILNRLLYNKKNRSLVYHLYLLMVVLSQTTTKKQIFLITFLILYAHL